MSQPKKRTHAGKKAKKTGNRIHLVFDPNEPFENAKLFLKAQYWTKRKRLIHFHQDQFFAWDGRTYPEIEEQKIISELWEFFAHARYGRKRFRPNRSKISNIFDALKGLTHLPNSHHAPCWLRTDARLPQELVVL
jgi:hypothetical protein